MSGDKGFIRVKFHPTSRVKVLEGAARHHGLIFLETDTIVVVAPAANTASLKTVLDRACDSVEVLTQAPEGCSDETLLTPEQASYNLGS